jgi:hypothetical protein
MYYAVMSRLLSLLLLFMVCTVINGCTTARFIVQQNPTINIAQATGMATLPTLYSLTTDELSHYCSSLVDDTDFVLIHRLHCSSHLLGRPNLSETTQTQSLATYNQAIYDLTQASKSGLIPEDRVRLSYTNDVIFTFTNDIISIDPRLMPSVLGEIGVPIVTRRDNTKTGLDLFAPLEGVYEDASINLHKIQLVDGLFFEVILNINTFNTFNTDTIKTPNESKRPTINIGSNQYTIKHSPGAAFLSLIEHADIDDYNWLGFVSAKEAEKRRGVFAVGGISQTKIPIIMIHGLNSDPLIWRHLTMAILNEPSLIEKHQVWHVYYPSGPPPFYNAARTRANLLSVVEALGNPELAKEAVIVGHSMGGVIAKLLATKADFELWDAAFTKRPSKVINPENIPLKDIFMFEPVFENNTVFFLDTPFKGSEVANSAIGYIGAFLVSLPSEFTQLFQDFIDRVGPDILTEKMRPFLIDYGPSSVHVLRPGHPLMDTLYNMPVVGDSYAIIGSNGRLLCDDEVSCASISDSVVSYSSANYMFANEKMIVRSSHNSFKSVQAIEFIVERLKKKITTQ